VTGGISISPDGRGHWQIEMQFDARRYRAGWGQSLIYAGRVRQEKQDWRRFPVLGVSVNDALAYASWLAATGRVPGARLCSEVEWERAARGADGRSYPGGSALDPNDANVDSTHTFELSGPDEVGSHPASRSPFGLDDMSGNAFEWTVSSTEESGYILRGGSYQLDRKTAHLTNRAPSSAEIHDITVGFRLCATPPIPR
jgi:formylglycine-generating enzyme required for sulfatase activity